VKSIFVVGSYNTGLTMLVEHLPRPGETVLGTNYSEGPGGKGSNQAVAAARLGADVSFVGCVGRDRFGDAAFKLWRREGVDSRFVRRSRTHTGLGFVVVGRQGSNAITVDAGANMDLGPSDVRRALGTASPGSVLLTQLEIPLSTVNAATRLGRTMGLTVILNPAPAVTAEGLELRGVDVITPNEQEFTRLTGGESLQRGTENLLHMGVGSVVVTLGSRGAFVRTSRQSRTLRPPKVKAVDTTGAGDAFSGALAVALFEGRPLREAVGFANAAGALTVTKREVIPALPRRRELEKLTRRRED
jgi:ribokinase